MISRDRNKRLPHLAARIGEDYADGLAACHDLLASMFDLQARHRVCATAMVSLYQPTSVKTPSSNR